MPRKKPFSGKKKKLQLKEKRKKKLNSDDTDSDESEEEVTDKGDNSEKVTEISDVKVINEQPEEPHKPFNPNRYRLQFLQESNAELKKRRELGRQILHPVAEEDLDLKDDYELDTIDIAKRPPWDYKLSTEALEKRETQYFHEYLEKIFGTYDQSELSYFELNLETWRQLWRVLEMSDIILMIVDIRYPMLHFSPALYNYIVHELGKHAILVLNKVDIVSPELVIAWKEFFSAKYPKLHIVCFTSFPKEAVCNRTPGKGKKKRRKGGKFTVNMGAKDLLEVCESIVHNEVDLSSWRHKIETEQEVGETHDEVTKEVDDNNSQPCSSSSQKYKDGILTIGCTGYPNVGKSSLLNGLKGIKVVSVSKTPGHTKHFQTIFITPTVKLCDCPGLVFPSKVDKSLQILAGIYPIAQVREPFSAIRYLAERINIPNILKLQHIDPDYKQWSPFDICEAWAVKRGLLTAKAGRPDIHRSANMILRMALDGRLCLALRPPGFTKNREIWKSHADAQTLKDTLSKYQEPPEDDEMSDENEFEDGYEDSEDSEEEQDEQNQDMSISNPFALLADS